MQLLFMNQWLPATLMKAICWTLIHSLWQGLILAALAGLLMLFTRRQTAAFRYNMLAVLFLVFMAVATGTFIVELNGPAPLAQDAPVQQAGQWVQPVLQEDLLPLGTGLRDSESVDYLGRFAGYFNEHATLLVTIWFVIFLAKALKLCGGLAYIQRVKHYKVNPPAHYWSMRVAELAAALGVGVPVRLLESGLVTVPMVAGLLKPVILVPVGLMANLPAEQVEAILLHELAHIRRRDFLVNLAQSFAETLFFFNPAVLWLSSLLREEREHCCDDMAIAITQSKKEYVHALVSFQEYQLENNAPYAMAFPGKKDQLLNRVKRIVDNRNKTLNLAEKTLLVVCLGLIMILSMVFARPVMAQAPTGQKEQPFSDRLTGGEQKVPGKPGTPALSPQTPREGVAEYQQAMANAPHTSPLPQRHDTLPGTVVYKEYSQPYREQIDPVNNSVYMDPYVPANRSVQVNPHAPANNAVHINPYVSVNYTVPAVPEYRPVPDTLPVLQRGKAVLTGVITQNKDGKEYRVTVDHNRAVGLIIDGIVVSDKELAGYSELISSIFRSMEAGAAQEQADRMKADEANDRRLFHRSNLLKEKNYQVNRQDQLPALRGGLPTLGKPDLHSKDSLLKKAPLAVNRTVIDEIIEELQTAGIITTTNPLSFRINQHEVVVNKVIQPQAVQDYFKQKYVKTPLDGYSYSKEGNRTSSTVHIDR